MKGLEDELFNTQVITPADQVGDKPLPPLPFCDDNPSEICKIYEKIQNDVEVYPDHIMINNSFPILQTPYFDERLSDMENFEGFSPRWLFPSTKMIAAGGISQDRIAT